MFVFSLNGPMVYSSNGTSFSYNACVTIKSGIRKEEIISVNIDLFLGPKLLAMYIIWIASFPGAAEVLVMYLPNILLYKSCFGTTSLLYQPTLWQYYLALSFVNIVF